MAAPTEAADKLTDAIMVLAEKATEGAEKGSDFGIKQATGYSQAARDLAEAVDHLLSAAKK